jgi:hypothetical protein
MVPLKQIKDYINKQLLLPHPVWGKKVAQQCYTGAWTIGYQLVTLRKYHPAKGGDHESLSFMADDNDDYKLVLQSLMTY